MGLREQHTCNNVHMSALPRNGFSAAFPTCSMSYCSFARGWTSALVLWGFRIASL